MIKKILNYFHNKRVLRSVEVHYWTSNQEHFIKTDGVFTYSGYEKSKLKIEVEVSHSDIIELLKNGEPQEFKFTYE